MAIVTRKSMGSYLHKCTTCKKQWVTSNEDGEPEASKHKH